MKEEIKKKINDYKDLEVSSIKKHVEKKFDESYFKIKERIMSRDILSI